jgi:hypothetical protein
MELKYFVVKERMENHLVHIVNIGTKEMIFDPLTKGLAPGLYSEHVMRMGLLNSFLHMHINKVITFSS